jgi:hypothetical protein
MAHPRPRWERPFSGGWSFHLIAAAVISTIVIATMRETAHEPLG